MKKLALRIAFAVTAGCGDETPAPQDVPAVINEEWCYTGYGRCIGNSGEPAEYEACDKRLERCLQNVKGG